MRPVNATKINFEHIRNGTYSIFTFVELIGGSHPEYCTTLDVAQEIEYLSYKLFPDAEK